MRRLDTFTIIIIAVCLIAAGLLIWIGYNKLAGNKENDKSALYEELQDDEEGDYYYLDDEDDSDLNAETDQAGTPSNFDDSGSNIEEDASANTSTTTADERDYEVVDKNDEETLTPRSYSSEGRYMVLAGSFKIMSNAENHARSIRNKGYSSTSVERFDSGVYAVVLVDRFSGLRDAQELVRKLKNDGVESYVKKK